MDRLNIDLRSVSSFSLVQADGPETSSATISDIREYKTKGEALLALEESEAPVKYIMFEHGGETYKIYPVEDTDEFDVIKTPTLH
jgi:hypothetical protein